MREEDFSPFSFDCSTPITSDESTSDESTSDESTSSESTEYSLPGHRTAFEETIDAGNLNDDEEESDEEYLFDMTPEEEDESESESELKVQETRHQGLILLYG